MIIDDFKQRLEQYLTDQSNTPVTILALKPLAGGASRDSWMLDAQIGEAIHKLVLRKDYATQMNEKALTRRQEFDLMQRALDSGVKVARVRFICDDDSILGQPFFLMDFVDGISIGPKVMQLPELEQARHVLPEQMAEQLAKIHAMPVDDFDWLDRPTTGKTPAQYTVEQTYAILDATGAHVPAFEYALRWAERHAPTDPEVTFVHGDFRIGNLLVNTQGLAAVIDWEFGHMGSPIEEIGYLCMRDWRFGNDHLHAAGLCPRERFIQAYEQFSGRQVDRHAADWWEIVGNLRWGIICLAQANRHLSGEDPSVELASLGRRSAEMQLEALRLIEKINQEENQ
ncbi:MAG: phosphotransferase family protein [Phototrophicales bacterium]